MIWHFGELGMENSIYTCTNGSVNSPNDATPGDCKLDTKPQPQWIDNWESDPLRSQIYNSWSRINDLKINEPVFEGNYNINSGSLTPKIYIWDDTLPSNSLKNVVILANFDVTYQNVTPNFPYTGVWHDLMDVSGNTTITVSNTSNIISIEPGEFKIYGNQAATTLSTNDLISENSIAIFPNPANEYFRVSQRSTKVIVYDILGNEVQTHKGNFSSQNRFDISTLRSGVYLISIETKNGSVTKKLLKY